VTQTIGPGLGASEIAAALGLSPYRSPLRLWQEKVGEVEAFQGNDFTRWGHAVEPALLDWYRRRMLSDGGTLTQPTASVYHPSYPWARATPDGVVEADSMRWLVQAKNASYYAGRRWDNGPPDEVVLQCQWEMWVTGDVRDDVIAAIGGRPPEIWTVYRDDVITADLFTAAERFWKLVETRTPPPVDHHEDWLARFRKRIREVNGVVAPRTPEIDEVAARLRDARRAIRELTKVADSLRNQILAYATDAGADAVETSLGTLTWHERAGAVSWKQTAEALASHAGVDLHEFAERHRSESTRAFAVPRSWDKE
jgi:putative phage-type endonuclease